MVLSNPSNNPIRSEASVGELFSPAEVYHENSKIFASNTELFANIQAVNSTPKLRRIISRPFTTYPGVPVVPLPEVGKVSEKSFESILRERRSVRKFKEEPIALTDLAAILYLGDGIVSEYHDPDGSVWQLRTAPSGGGLYPIDLFCFALNIDGLENGLYFYNTRRHHLEQIQLKDYRTSLQDATHLNVEFGTASCCIAMKCIPSRSNFKYGERAYRFMLLEAGHIAQNLSLAATALGLASLPVGGFIDDRVNALLKADGCDEFVIYLVAFGKP